MWHEHDDERDTPQTWQGPHYAEPPLRRHGAGAGGEGHEGSKGGLLFVTVTLCFSVCSVSPGISGALRGQQGK